MLGRPPTSALFPYTTLFRSVYRVDLQTRQTELWDKVESDIHPSGYEVEQVTYPSKDGTDRKSTRLNSSHQIISYAVFCLKKKNHNRTAAANDAHHTRNATEV